MNKRIIILSGTLLLALGILLADLFSNPKVSISDNQIKKSCYDFIPEHWQEPYLAKLYHNENFKEIQADSQFELFLLLCDWTHRQWKHSMPDPYPLSNAIDILKDIRSGLTGGFCGQYAYVLADVFKTLGYYNVRYAELWNQKGQSHFVVEVWSDQFKKWIILDPDLNMYFRMIDSGIPACALDIRKSFYGGEPVEAIDIKSRKKRTDTAKRAELFRNFALSLRSDLMRHREALTVQNRYDTFLFFRDNNTNKPFEESLPYGNITSDPGDLYFDCNKVRVEHQISRNQIDFTFHTDSSMPNFKGFMIFTGNKGQWHPAGKSYSVRRNDKIDMLSVAPVNQNNQLGIVNIIQIQW